MCQAFVFREVGVIADWFLNRGWLWFKPTVTSLRTDSWKHMLMVENETVCLKFDNSDYLK